MEKTRATQENWSLLYILMYVTNQFLHRGVTDNIIIVLDATKNIIFFSVTSFFAVYQSSFSGLTPLSGLPLSASMSSMSAPAPASGVGNSYETGDSNEHEHGVTPGPGHSPGHWYSAQYHDNHYNK